MSPFVKADVVDGLLLMMAVWVLVRPPSWLRRFWAARNTSRGTTAGIVFAFAATLFGFYLAAKLPQASTAERLEMVFPFVTIDIIAAAQYRAFRRPAA